MVNAEAVTLARGAGQVHAAAKNLGELIADWAAQAGTVKGAFKGFLDFAGHQAGRAGIGGVLHACGKASALLLDDQALEKVLVAAGPAHGELEQSLLVVGLGRDAARAAAQQVGFGQCILAQEGGSLCVADAQAGQQAIGRVGAAREFGAKKIEAVAQQGFALLGHRQGLHRLDHGRHGLVGRVWQLRRHAKCRHAGSQQQCAQRASDPARMAVKQVQGLAGQLCQQVRIQDKDPILDSARVARLGQQADWCRMGALQCALCAEP